MWIKKQVLNNLIKRIEYLESNQFNANERVKQYIEDSESLSNQLYELINDLPHSLLNILSDNCGNK